MTNTEHTATIAMSQDFLAAYTALPRKIQGKVSDFLDKFRANPKSPGINYEKIRDAFDPAICSVRIDNTYRGIVIRQPDSSTYILLWVDHHDEAYEWARRKRCAVNPTTGTIQLFSVMEREADVVPAAINNPAENQPCAAGLFDSISDANLKRLGAPEELIPFIRSLKSEEQLSQKGAGILPHDVYTALSYAANFELHEVFDMLAAERSSDAAEIDTQDFAAALKRPSSMASFTVIDGEDDLRRIIEAPLEKWRVFLHPTQRELTTSRFSGPARVMGAAGTGKTVVAMHRAKHLASLMKDGERLLFTTFTINLASDIRSNLSRICTEQEMSRIETINIDEWVKNFRNEHALTSVITYNTNGGLSAVWLDAVKRLRADADKCPDFASLSAVLSSYKADDEDKALAAFCMDEWEQTAAVQDAFTEEAYLKADRAGRGIRLGRAKRQTVAKVFAEYMNVMRERNICDIYTAMAECRRILEDTTPPYRHVIADEGQDLSPSAFRLIRAMADEADNDIFIVGDANQRIYKHACSLAKCGIQIRGKSSVLKINYRTTGEIHRAAFSVLPGAGEDERYSAVSLTSGSAPVIRSFRNASEEFDFILGEIADLEAGGVPLSSICITARSAGRRDSLMKSFEESGVPCCRIESHGVEPGGCNSEGIRFATMHRIKGLEFQYVFIASLNNGLIPFGNADEEDIIRERRLLYVAMTRAQRGVWLTNYWKPSPFLADIEQYAAKAES